MLLEVPSVTVDEARDADEALRALAALAPVLVVLDIHMPGKTGFSILPLIKAAPSPPLVIVMTNYPTEHLRRKCLDVGADFFFDKSKQFERVIEVVVALARTRASRPGIDES